MIDEFDESLRQLLVRELPIKNNEVDIAFDQPKREWSARLSRPTLNVFLYDLRENSKLRLPSPAWQTERHLDRHSATRHHQPLRMDLSYMITAWATEPEDEHRLLARTLMALRRAPEMPADLLSEDLKNQPVPIPLQSALHDMLEKSVDLWGVLDSEMRPSISLLATLAFDPYHPVTAPLVRERQLRIGQVEGDIADQTLLAASVEELWPDRPRPAANGSGKEAQAQNPDEK